MMQFRTIRDSVRRILAQYSQGEYLVIGAQKRGKGAAEVLDKARLVEVYYSRGDFPKSGGGVAGPTKHDITFRIDLTVSKASEGDTATIENPSSTDAERAAALAAMMESQLLANDSLDALFNAVYQVLMDARHMDLGLPKGNVASRWVSQLEKDEPIERGNYTIITGSMLLTCTTSEPVYGLVGIEAGNIFDMELQLDTDEPGKAGVRTGE
jgi:hypothetical protein